MEGEKAGEGGAEDSKRKRASECEEECSRGSRHGNDGGGRSATTQTPSHPWDTDSSCVGPTPSTLGADWLTRGKRASRERVGVARSVGGGDREIGEHRSSGDGSNGGG